MADFGGYSPSQLQGQSEPAPYVEIGQSPKIGLYFVHLNELEAYNVNVFPASYVVKSEGQLQGACLNWMD